MILVPVDDSGTMKELCSDACLSSFNSRRNTAAHNRPLQTGCKTCARTGKVSKKTAYCSPLMVIKNNAVQTLMNLGEKFEAIFFNVHTLLPQKRKLNDYGYLKSVLY